MKFIYYILEKISGFLDYPRKHTMGRMCQKYGVEMRLIPTFDRGPYLDQI